MSSARLKPTVKVPLLRGLSPEDRKLMLTLMTALGSAATSMLAAKDQLEVCAEDEGTHNFKDPDITSKLDVEVTAIIALCRECKDRLEKGGSTVSVN